MQTPATLHVQQCSEPGCLNDAVVTKADGDFRMSPKGACLDHIETAFTTATERKQMEENKILRDLGFNVAA